MTLRSNDTLRKMVCWTRIAGLAMLTLTFLPNSFAGESQDGNNKKPESRVASAAAPRHDSQRKESGSIVIKISDVTVPESRELCPASIIKQKKCKGEANLTLNRDGTWNFTGTYPWSEQGSHMDFVLGVKDSKGTLLIFTASASSTTEGYIWSKQGDNRTIKDNWASFADGYHWYWKGRVLLVYDHPASGGGGPSFGDIIGDIGKALGVAAAAAAIF